MMISDVDVWFHPKGTVHFIVNSTIFQAQVYSIKKAKNDTTLDYFHDLLGWCQTIYMTNVTNANALSNVCHNLLFILHF